MYGRMRLAVVLPEVRKAGAEYIDVWPEPHANHREQMEAIGYERFAAMLRRHKVKLGILTHYDLGPFDLQKEMAVAKELGARMVICGSRGPANLQGNVLKAAIREFVEKMKPHVAVAQQEGVTIGIENHLNSLLESPDSMRWFAEFIPSKYLGVALAPYHLPQDPSLVARLIADLDDRLVHFYAWQYGRGCQKKLPKHQELLQLPGRGKLDFEPIIAELEKIGYKGLTEIFMHAVPRGAPIHAAAAEVTNEINRARIYLETCLSKI